MSNNTLSVPVRPNAGKSATKQIRKQGLIPAVEYGLGKPPVALSVNPKDIAKIIASDSGVNTVITLQREGGQGAESVLIKEIQRHHLTGRLRHIDFLRVDTKKSVRVRVPVRLIGIPYGVKTEGGLLEFVHREIEVECLPTNIPPHIDVDVTELKLNESIRFDQIALSADYKIVGEAHEVIAAVNERAEEEIVTPVAAASADGTASADGVAPADGTTPGAPTEPEIVGKKGKKPEEEK